MTDIKEAIWKKAEERGTTIYIENRKKHLKDISESEDVVKIWNSYKEKYPYAKDIEFIAIINTLRNVLE